MPKKSIYVDAPADIADALAHSTPVVDDLPAPDKLVRHYPKTEITTALKKKRNTRSNSEFLILNS
jgi:hypothetical protein